MAVTRSSARRIRPAKTKQALPVNSSTPSSASLDHFLKRRQPGTAILPLMPTEIHQTIAECLDIDSLANLRLTCHEIESKTLWYFAMTYFTDVKFGLSRFALQALVNMSRSRMAQYVHTLHLGPASNDQGDIIGTSTERVSAATKQAIISDMIQYAEENRRMRLLGEDSELIRLAFQNLRRLTTLNFLDCCEFCGHCTLVSSYDIDLDVTQSMARVFSVALHAAEAASLSLECVDAHMSNMPGLNGLREASTAGFTIVPLDFPVLNPTSALQSSSFEKLTVLRIFVGFKRDLVDEERLERFRLRLISFITQASSLHTLGLTFRPSLTLRKRICVKGFIKDLILSSSLRRMKVFELTGMTSILPALIEAFKPLRKTLRGVKMYHVLLLDGSWVEWIEWVRDMVINLEDLDIDHARETFPPPACHKGSGMKDCLNDTIKKWEGIRERFYKYDYNDNFYDHSEESNDHSEESNDHSEESNDHSEESNDHSEDSDDDF